MRKKGLLLSFAAVIGRPAGFSVGPETPVRADSPTGGAGTGNTAVTPSAITVTPSGGATSTPTPKPTATPTAKPTPTPTAKPTATPTLSPKPTATPTAKPTATDFARASTLYNDRICLERWQSGRMRQTRNLL